MNKLRWIKGVGDAANSIEVGKGTAPPPRRSSRRHGRKGARTDVDEPDFRQEILDAIATGLSGEDPIRYAIEKESDDYRALLAQELRRRGALPKR